MRKTGRILQQLVDYLPSKSFMHVKVKRPGQKSHFIKVASELELFRDFFGAEALKSLKITDDTWRVLMETDWQGRHALLMEMARKPEEKPEKVEISVKNREKIDNGEMVYARGFHSLLELYGADFRRQIDIFYGRNWMKNGDEKMLKNLIVDCRFLRGFSVASQAKYTGQMQSLHDENWLSPNPFSINFVNYLPDEQLSAVAARNLLFRYGPATKTENFTPHPFAPVLTPRRIDSVEKKAKILYISSKATRFLPETLPPQVNSIAICISNESSPSTSSMSACIADRIVPYRIPFQKYVRSERFRPNSLQLWQLGRVIRDYFSGNSIESSICRNLDILVNSSGAKKRQTNQREEEFRSAMERINS